MAPFRPTVAPVGRLCRLGVVVDASRPDWQRIATLADRAGLGAVWIADRLGADDAEWSMDPRSDLLTLASVTSVTTVGLMVSADRDPGSSTRFAVDLARRTGRDVDLTLSRADLTVALEVLGPHEADGRAGPPIRLSSIAASTAELRGLLDRVDDVVLPAWCYENMEGAADEARAEAVEAGRDPATLGVSALLPVSIGRTETEAAARADGDPVFAHLGHPRTIGIFGTLEDCQDRVIALAHAGVTDLRVILPAASDVHDVIAQLTAMTIGTTDVLVPGALRSPAPPPPEGWGGRPDQPPRPRVSGGSRRH